MITSAQYTGYKMEREERYYIVKKSDLKYALEQGTLIGADIDSLKCILESVNLERHRRGKSDLTAVVVESDWPEYERVWKMIEARVNMENQHDAVHHSENHISLSEGVLVFAQLMVEAVIQDAYEEGYDLTAGLFGPHLSQLMVQVNEWRKKAELYDKLVDLMGHVQNGTDDVIKIFQDDATMSYCVGGGYQKCRHWCEAEPSLEKAIVKAHEKHAGD